MEIVAFEVSRYRSIKKTERLSLGNPTVIVGPNNEGKSNIIRALTLCVRFICAPRDSILDRTWSYEWSRDFPIELQNRKKNLDSVFLIELKLNTEERDRFRERVGSKNNGTLKIVVSMGPTGAQFDVLKQGSGKEAMRTGASKIRQFVQDHLRIQYIPAVRTAGAARDVIHQLIEDDLAQVESSTEYQKALQAISDLQKPIMDSLSNKLSGTLKDFLPAIKTVQISTTVEARRRALRSTYDIQIDDGTKTSLDRKGDGVQSLAALALMKHAVTPQNAGMELVLAIEEPESHLHPTAIHQLQAVILELSRKHQVVISTHCPLFVDRRDVSKNIIVNNKSARAARDVEEIRTALGVRVSDNLRNAELVLIVEGETDRQTLSSVFKNESAVLGTALDTGLFAIDSLAGATNLTYKLQHLRDSLCRTVVLLDKDQSADAAKAKAIAQGLASAADVFQLHRGGKEAELEDLIIEALYSDFLKNNYGIDIGKPTATEAKQKWSDRLVAMAGRQGHPLSDTDVTAIKIGITKIVTQATQPVLNKGLRGPIDNLISELEKRCS